MKKEINGIEKEIFEVLDSDIPMKKRDVLCGPPEDRVFKKLWVCGYCFPKNYKKKVLSDDYRFGNITGDKEEMLDHMRTCNKNPRKIKVLQELEVERRRLFNLADKKKIEPKFLMASGYYHKLLSDPDMGYEDLCQVTMENEEVYIGSFVFGIGMFDVVFPKNKVRELTEEEVEKYHGKNISISSNPPCASLNIKENKFDKPITYL